MAKPKVLLAGATGYVAVQSLPEIREKHGLKLIDIGEEGHRRMALDIGGPSILLQEDM